MNVTYACCQCHRTNRQSLDDQSTRLTCNSCGHEQGIPEKAIQHGHLSRCVVCPSDELFLRKDFSQRLGLTIIALGFIGSSVAWYYYAQYVAFGILMGTALIDVVLYLVVGNLLQCYRCRSEYREVANLERYEPFDLEAHERHRQQEARLAEAAASGAAAASGRRVPGPAETVGGKENSEPQPARGSESKLTTSEPQQD